MSAEIVGPLPTVTFRGGPREKDSGVRGRNARAPKVVYTPPKNTLDPRYEACTEHRVACDCREAEFAEERDESRAEWQALREAFEEHLAGHPTWLYDAEGDERLSCQCTGCRIARAAHIWPRTAAEQ